MSSGTDRTCDVLILGASYAGIEVVYQLVRLSEGRLPSVVVVDRQESHGYLPLVQERLCGRLDAAETRVDTRTYVESVARAKYIQGEITGFDPETRTVRLEDGTALTGGTVVVALGSIVEPAAENSGLVPYKTRAQFEDARGRLMSLLEGATDSGDDRPSVVVVGGGVSGVELAGELADLARERPSQWAAPRVTLVGSGPRLLDGFSTAVSDRIARALHDQGVDVRLDSRVISASEGVVSTKQSGETVEIPADLALWAAGVRPNPLFADLGLPLTDDGWLSVGPTLQCFATPTPTHPEILACGDAVRVHSGDGTWPTMQRAIEAIWQAKVVAANVLTLLSQKPGFPDGVPPLRPHRLRETFFYGLSVGAKSFVHYRGFMLDLPAVNRWFRRWLMRQYFRRYRPLPGAGPAQLEAESGAE